MSMADRDGWIWYDGKMVPWRDATTHVLTHTLHYGMGVFEGVRAYKTPEGPAIFRLRDHTDRLFRSAQIFGMKIPHSKEAIDAAQLACVRDNKLESCYLRPLVFYGSEAMGVAAKSNPVRVAVAVRVAVGGSGVGDAPACSVANGVGLPGSAGAPALARGDSGPASSSPRQQNASHSADTALRWPNCIFRLLRSKPVLRSVPCNPQTAITVYCLADGRSCSPAACPACAESPAAY